MKRYRRGFSLIELLVGVAILGILLALSASSFRTWIGNMRIRTTAESILNGLQLARGEAVRRNALIRFQLVDNLTAGCALSTTASNWIVNMDPDNPAGRCDAAFLDESIPAAANLAPRILQRRTAAEGSRNVLVAANQSFLIFNGLGRVTNAATIDVGPVAAVGNCPPFRCLRVTVSVGGQIRMCDPAYPAGGTDPQRC